MRARASCLLLVALSLAGPARAEPATGPFAPLQRSGGDAALPKLRALLFQRPPGLSLKAPGSPRYLALQDPGARGTRLLVGWVLPGLTAAELPELRVLTDWLARELRARRDSSLPFDASVSLDMDGEAPFLVVELSSSRVSAMRELEQVLLGRVARLSGAAAVVEPTAPDAAAPAPPPEVPARVSELARAHLSPLARAVVELHRPDAPSVVRTAKPWRHVVERGDTLSEIALANGLDLGALSRLNHLDPRRPIKAGDELKLSDKGPPRPKLYVVKSGDSLAKVARQFGVSEKALVEANRLDGRRLSKGQKLVLPR